MTESPNANAVQVPLGLARNLSLTVLAVRGSCTPEGIRRLASVVELPLDPFQGSVLGACRFAALAIGHIRHMGHSERLLGFATYCDVPGIIIGLAISLFTGVPWVIFCWDHPYPLQVGRTDMKARLVGAGRRALLRLAFGRARMTCFQYPDEPLGDLLPAGRPHWSSPNGTPVDLIDAELLATPPEPFLVGMLTAVTPTKRVDWVLLAIWRLRQKLPSIRLRIVGEVHPAVAPGLQEQVRSLGLVDSVETSGWLPFHEALAAMAPCEVCVCAYPPVPELKWNYVLKVGEYLALGKPVVAVDAPGTRAYVEHGENGLLVPFADAERLAEALYSILTLPALRQRMSAQARATAEGLSWTSITRGLAAAIAEGLGDTCERPAPRGPVTDGQAWAPRRE